MSPLWQYFARVSRKKADESITAPKGHGSRTLSAFPLQTPISGGPLEGTIIALLDPNPAAAGLGAKAMPRCASTCSGHVVLVPKETLVTAPKGCFPC
jgi:hypothetical protein